MEDDHGDESIAFGGQDTGINGSNPWFLEEIASNHNIVPSSLDGLRVSDIMSSSRLVSPRNCNLRI